MIMKNNKLFTIDEAQIIGSEIIKNKAIELKKSLENKKKLKVKEINYV